MLKPTQEVLSDAPKSSKPAPLPNGLRLKLTYVGWLAGIAAGISFAISLLTGYALDYFYNLGRLQTIGAMLLIWSIATLAVGGIMAVVIYRHSTRRVPMR
jgi:amino acid transporter